MVSKNSIRFIAIIALAFTLSTTALAQQQAQPPAGGASESAQVAQLKAELAKMKAEMDAMRGTMQSSQGMSPQERQMMQQHMGRMQEDWQHMYDMCGTWDHGHMMMH
ncbi:MAG TPA: hypothetical protein VKT99_04815 [Xanthobacteraceae bacterium]|nr:hypothetical protein [Xanthobacteraceae bacterium]